MAELAAIRVLNVVRTYEYEKDTRSGIKKKEHHAVFSVEGGNIDVVYDPSIEIPVGWSGRALVDLYARNVPYTRNDGSTYNVILFSAYTVRNFVKGYKHPELSEIIPRVQK